MGGPGRYDAEFRVARPLFRWHRSGRNTLGAVVHEARNCHDSGHARQMSEKTTMESEHV